MIDKMLSHLIVTCLLTCLLHVCHVTTDCLSIDINHLDVERCTHKTFQKSPGWNIEAACRSTIASNNKVNSTKNNNTTTNTLSPTRNDINPTEASYYNYYYYYDKNCSRRLPYICTAKRVKREIKQH